MKVITLTIFLFFIQTVKSQTDTNHTYKNAIFLEVLGIGGYWSINYEREFYTSQKLKIAGRLGVSTLHLTDFTTQFNPDVVLPLAINAFIGKRHHLEIGVGQTISFIVEANSVDFKPEHVVSFHTSFTIGYRYQKKLKGLFYRIAYMPIIEFNKYYRNWAGASIGYKF